MGINVLDAGFRVDEYCPNSNLLPSDCSCAETPNRSLFKQFYRAVNINNTGCQYTFEVDHTDFDNNTRSVNSCGVNNF